MDLQRGSEKPQCGVTQRLTELVSSVWNHGDRAVLCWALDLPGGQLICMSCVLSTLQNCLAGRAEWSQRENSQVSRPHPCQVSNNGTFQWNSTFFISPCQEHIEGE